MKRELPPDLRPLCLNVWAWECYMRGCDELRSEADNASREAAEACPDSASILDTRGHVLLWNARYAEAEGHLQRAYGLATNPSTRASAAAGMAMLCASRNRPDDARLWLSRGRQENMHQRVTARAVAAVEPLSRVS